MDVFDVMQMTHRLNHCWIGQFSDSRLMVEIELLDLRFTFIK